LQYAGLTEYFEQPLSIDAVKMYKPANECYQYAANALGLETEDMLMVAAHGWDIAGSMAASMQDAFIERKGHSPYSLSTSHNIPEKIW
jgi:2-haloacid dehalogenase